MTSHAQSYHRLDVLDEADSRLAQGGRTFHFARQFLGAKSGKQAAQLYSLCRYLDDCADGDIENGPQKLQHFQQDLHSLGEGGKTPLSDPVLVAMAPFLQQHHISLTALSHLIEGLVSDQMPVALPDEAALIRYGYHVAGTVGMMMCPLLACRDESAMKFAVDMGIAMQLTNIARDVKEDAQMGRRYLPANWVNGLSAAAIATGAETQDKAVITKVKGAVARCLRLADHYYHSGFAGLSYLPARPRFAIAVAAHAYREIGTCLAEADYSWHEGRVVTSLGRKAKVSLRAFPILWQGTPNPHHTPLHQPLAGLV